ncbi:decaprenyl-phosphate phosphoribosyltransferase [Crossiella cryophila]|uniref:Decaprenyl-phosphate phosphoribosyltransferase n=1 Tax=Crossiella cryophila TaxID=43355 RepID=A0A7W7C5X9_9PSEU|nr:decaprenyl-phosphate phosphoribosyltransferase [Crossiella cryophila]MBB4675116.1 decaprenyl-phosphate phosphoribosyltransferase [Crossiella cryophila]
MTASAIAPAPSLGLGVQLRGLARALRPRQWVKNVLVLAAPFASGTVGDPRVLAAAGIAFAAFCLAGSAIYLVNDVQDVEADRAHPVKCRRPIAAGIVPPRLALALAAVLLTAALATSTVASLDLTAVVAVYLAVQVGYCLALKHQPVIDLCIVASGFLLRAIAGGAAAGILLSQWFLLAAAFGSLFMVAGKRYAELRYAERTGARIRRSLDRYSSSYLRFVWGSSATVLIMTYGLWAFEIRERSHSVWAVLSMIPFVMAVLRYAVDVDSANAGAPEHLILSDRPLQALGLCWLATLSVAVYLS